ncbi:MAG: VOC family protein [Bifidobacteriaceae bacterium]|jgi:catechol 2,3-dioxygenase-like lactoylglutathione lyase family enzyme|nr:VOC family protein [Bifidobacteriaceae bacterium]
MTQAIRPDANVTQICFVTDDVERSAKYFAALLGIEPPTEYAKAADPAVARAVYRGQTNADVGCKIAMFTLGNLDIEFLEPDGRPSAWQELLDAKGPCIHHIAFASSDVDADLPKFAEHGAELAQKGDYDGNSGQYAYVDTVPQLGAFIELLQDYER